jgi:hypothetical protein
MAAEQTYEGQALAALRKAVAAALERKRRLGQYAVVWRGGRPVRIGPEVTGSTDEYGIERAAPVPAVRERGPEGGGKGESA